VIPFKVFVLAVDATHNFGAELELRMAHAEAYGSALAFGESKNSHKLRRYQRGLLKQAHPEVPIDGS
jgi:hypothetical protein